MSGVILRNVTKSYGALRVIHGINLTVEAGEFCAFIGPKGCGKSMVLRLIAGLEETSGGTVQFGARDVTWLRPAQRGVAVVFPSDARYPQGVMSENGGSGAKQGAKRSGHLMAIIAAMVAAVFSTLKAYLHEKPEAKTVAQCQRAAIGRAMACGAEVVLLDDPLLNLDAAVRAEMRAEFARRQRETAATMIYVTDDPTEAMTLADKIVVFRDGAVEQTGTPQHLQDDPDNTFVAMFIGSPAMNFITARAQGDVLILQGLGTAPLPRHLGAYNGTAVVVGLRAQHLTLTKGTSHRVDGADVCDGRGYIYLTGPGGDRVMVQATTSAPPVVGSKAGIGFDPAQLLLFDAVSSRRLR